MSDQTFISADSHVNISHDKVKERLASKWHDDYDRAVTAFAARMQRGAGKANAAGAKMETRRTEVGGSNSVFTRPGYSEGPARLEDMDIDGVDIEVIYSEVSAFRYLGAIGAGTNAAVKAFNNALTDFASADPRRLVVSYQVPIDDIPAAVQEIQRVAALGAKSLQLPVFPSELGLPDYHDERYDPLWSVVTETGLPVCCHIGLNTALDDLTQRDPTPQKGIMVPVTGLMTAEPLGMWIMGGVLERFPELQVVFVEPGLTWVVWWLWLVDDMVTRQGYQFPAISELPSFYFHRNVNLTFIDEPIGVQRLRDLIGVTNILWSTDYPHPVTSWPKSRMLAEEQFATVPEDERVLMTYGNAARIWRL